MKKLGSHRFLPLLLVIVFAMPAFAGEYFEKDGVTIGGYDPVAYFVELKPVKGLPEFYAAHQGSTCHFSTMANQDLFMASPDKFAPQYLPSKRETARC